MPQKDSGFYESYCEGVEFVGGRIRTSSPGHDVRSCMDASSRHPAEPLSSSVGRRYTLSRWATRVRLWRRPTPHLARCTTSSMRSQVAAWPYTRLLECRRRGAAVPKPECRKCSDSFQGARVGRHPAMCRRPAAPDPHQSTSTRPHANRPLLPSIRDLRIIVMETQKHAASGHPCTESVTRPPSAR
jgi:hypothetical protein